MASSISGIGPMSMYPISSVRQVDVKPQNYAVENESEVSDAFSESMAVNGASGITGPSPVQYANAEASEGGQGGSPRVSAQRASQLYNQIASSFQGTTTSYDASGNGGQYAMVGGTIDVSA